MKLSLPVLLLTFLAAACNRQPAGDRSVTRPAATATDSLAYQNPLDVQFGDPYIMDDGNGTYYLYGTGGGAEDGFSVFSSTNLTDWNYENQIYYGNNDSTWNESAFWAPECYKFNDRYYLFYSANRKVNPTNEEENFHIGVAVSDSPTGPFDDLQDEPIFSPGYPILDANVYLDDDGKYYLYYSRACYEHPVESEVADWAREEGLFNEIEESWIYGVELAADFKSVIGEPVLLLRPPLKMDDPNAEWESRSVTSGEVNRRWTEGSFTFQHDGTYYMMYSANFYAGPNYAVGYATADAPLGPYTKATNNPVLEKNVDEGGQVTGTGHNSILFLDGSDRMICVYHGRTKPTGDERVVFMDEMSINEDGILTVNGPTTDPKKIELR